MGRVARLELGEKFIYARSIHVAHYRRPQ
jgi:hypothetical protein